MVSPMIVACDDSQCFLGSSPRLRRRCARKVQGGVQHEAHVTAAFCDARFAEHISVKSRYAAGEAVLFGERLAGDSGHPITSLDKA